MTSLLARCEYIKKDKHGKHCHNQQISPPQFVVSVDGMQGRKAIVVLSQSSLAISEKREEPLLQLWGWVNKRIEITVARS